VPVSTSYLDYVIEQLAESGDVSSRRMFGAVGLYRGGQFFGLIDDDTLYLKVDDRNRGDYLARGMAPFRPYRDRPEFSMSYYQAPIDVIEDAEQLAHWARAAVRAAVESPSKSSVRKRAQSGKRRSGGATASRKRSRP
jgi:DNA transformation protein and related proteins